MGKLKEPCLFHYLVKLTQHCPHSHLGVRQNRQVVIIMLSVLNLTYVLFSHLFRHDFRPDYTKLGILKHHFPSVPVLCVTATASDRVRQDCCNILRLQRNHLFFRSTANRPNLTYKVKCKADSKDAVIKDMVAFIKENHENEAGIIYTFSRKEADEVADSLCNHGIVARAYHSDVSDSRKTAVHRSWMRNATQVRITMYLECFSFVIAF